MIRAALRADLPRIRELLARANDMPYDLAAVAEEKCFERGFEGEAAATLYGDFEGIAVTCGKREGHSSSPPSRGTTSRRACWHRTPRCCNSSQRRDMKRRRGHRTWR